MQVVVNIPDELASALALGTRPLDLAALEGMAAEGYRSGLLSELQLAKLLNFPSRFAVHDWLRARQIPYRYTEVDLDSDLEALTDLGLR